MTNYKNIFGKPVKFLATDPDNAEAEGQIWYNSTSDAFKSVLVNEAWSSSANKIDPVQWAGGLGSQTAGLSYGGEQPASQNLTEEYNGSGWSSSSNLNTGRNRVRGCGSQTAGLAFGGATPPLTNTDATELYDGSTWTSNPTGLSSARFTPGAAGTQTSALAFGGYGVAPFPSGSVVTSTEEFNGTSWTAGGPLNTARSNMGGAGTQTAALGFAGDEPAASTKTESYDGSTWTNVNALNSTNPGGYGCGTSQTAALSFGGTNPAEIWDGTNWAVTASMATARPSLGGFGSSSAAVGFGAGSPPLTSTEEYNRSINVITAAAWSAGGNLPTAKSDMADGGTQTAAIEGAGFQNNPDAAQTSSSEYNGTSWTAGNILPAYKSGTGATGTQTALITGGAGSGSTSTFEYDGTNWTSGGALGTGRYQGKNLGTQTAAVYCGGRVSPPTLNNVEEYDGSTWTSATGMPVATRSGGGYGIQTAGTIVSGFQGPSTPPVSPTATISRSLPGFNYDGTSWTTGTSALIAGASGGAAGTQTNAIYLAGGNPALSPAAITTSQKYDGTSYTTDAALGRSQATGFGITSSRTAEVGSAAMIFGGNNPPATPGDFNSTEEYNVATTALNLKTLTTS